MEVIMKPFTNNKTVSLRAVRLPRVCDLTGASRATIWRKVKEDASFPRPFKLSPAITVWDEAEVLQWLTSKKAETLRSLQVAELDVREEAGQ
jgi:predicted DNA-binding transcriptional regulator AlpA